MDIFLGTWYTVRKVTFLVLSNTCIRDVYRTRRVLKYILEAHFMRSAVPFWSDCLLHMQTKIS